MAADPDARRLPPFTEALILPDLPETHNEGTLALVKVPAWEPDAMTCWGYLVRLLDGGRARVLGCLEAEGRLWRCSAPLDGRPEGEPLVRGLSYGDRPGGEVVGRVDGHDTVLAWWEPNGDGLRLTYGTGPTDLGPYGDEDAALDFRGIVVGGYLVRERLVEAAAVNNSTEDGHFLGPLLSEPLPDAVEGLMDAGRRPSASPLARYASRELRGAGASSVRAVVAATGTDMVRLASTHLWWARFPREADPGERRLLLAVEAAVNRVQLAMDVEPEEGYRSQEDVARAVARAVAGVASGTREALGAHKAANPLRTYGGETHGLGSEWDVRTRIARACERLRLPFRLEYRYDVDPAIGAAAVEFAVPEAALLPAEGDPEAVATAYGVRLAAALAACAFGSSVLVTRVVVTGFAGSLGGEAVLSADLGRAAFSGPVMEAVEADLEEPGDGAAAIVAAMGAHLRTAADGAEVEPFKVAGLKERRVELWRDRRPLPPELADSLRADVAADLDVYFDRYPDDLEEVRAVAEEEADSPITAIMRLEEVADRVLGKLADRRGDLAGKLPLYCNSAAARILVAEAPAGAADVAGIDGASDPTGIAHGPDAAVGSGPVRYYQLPDAYFQAKDALAHRYADIGEHERALACMEQCVALAPSSIPPRIYRAVLFGDAGNFMAVVGAVKELLTMLVDRDDTAFCLYRLAFAYWRLSMPVLAAAAYTCAQRSPRMADQARIELADLLRESGLEAPDQRQAEALLKAEGVPVAPDQRLVDFMARASADLVDEGVPLAAWRPLLVLADRENSDDLHSVAASLRDGTPSAYDYEG